jgi:ABC-type glycerol-3-phosphate transport system substrate-binding protein
MSLERDRRTSALADAFMTGRIPRRSFISGLLGLGLAPSVAGTIVAAGTSRETALAAQSGVPSNVSGEIRFMIGPWTDQEVEHQQKIAAAFNKLYPNVTFTFKLYSWDTSTTEIDASLADGAHDIYHFSEGTYLARVEQKNGFQDLAAWINDPAFAAEKAKYLYWDRIEAYGPKLIGMPHSFNVEDALFVNMDMVKAAGFDETFVDKWDTFLDCVTKMTKGTDVYGLGIGIQIGGYAEWYQRARAAGGRYLTPDLSKPAINTPAVVEATQQMVDFFKKGIAPPQGTYDYNTAPDAFIAGKLATYSSDLSVAAVLQAKPNPPAFTWSILPYPPGSATRVNFNNLGFYAMSSKTPNKDLAWEVLKFWTNGEQSAYWSGVSGTYPPRSDAVEMGYGKYSAPQLAAAFDQFQKYSVGPEPFAQWGTIETLAEAQIARAYNGEISAADAVKNVEQIVQQEALS